MSDIAFVREDMLPEKAPPASNVGIVGWMRENLFSGILNSVLTISSLLVIFYVLVSLLPWVFSGTWSAGSLKECREIFAVNGGGGGHGGGACWGVIRERWIQLMFGFYPSELYWRPVVTFGLLFVAVIPVLFSMISRRMNWFLLALLVFLTTFAFGGVFAWMLRIISGLGLAYLAYTLVSTDKADRATQIAGGAKRLPNPLIFTALFPFVFPWLLWGGSAWVPIGAILGFVIGYFAYSILARTVSGLIGLIVGPLAAIVWWLLLSGTFAGVAESIIPLSIEVVESRKFGGFMLSITIGVVAIVGSLPLGIVLALGRQSDLMIVKALCVGFIEFIRGVPLITLLFVASTLLNVFMPPGTNFDIILRVLIMVTLFAAAYMAEVVRGGLAALPTGQYEGADSLGLNYWQAQRLVIMPQALKISIPGIVSTFIGVFKDTTLVSIIGLLDPLGLSTAIRADANWNGVVWELYGFIALLFFVFCFSMSRYSMYLERKLQTGH
ncbi:amino acid ABC transporter permease [Shimia sp.]|uniref:amino acid ABC transporter permease n=1 Tax=Shimia sp. TaxID=1954381 RepID=UPI0032987AB4